MIGEQVQQYLVQRKLNEGAMGSIYLALDTTLDRPVALKFVLSDINNHPGMARRFLEEAKVLASLNRPNIPVLYGYFIWNDRGVIAMEYVDGESFESMILRRGPIPAAVCVPLVKQALTGLAFAHQRGIVHRDLKPGNLMINQEGTVKVVDFGIAKKLAVEVHLTATNTTVGTPMYMAPEQIMGKPVDARTDIYAMGVVLYELLAGQVPFNADSLYEIQAAHIHRIPDPPTIYYPHIPRPVVDAVMKALQKNPADRFACAEDFIRALPELEPMPTLVPDTSISPAGGAHRPVLPPPTPVPSPAPIHHSANPDATAVHRSLPSPVSPKTGPGSTQLAPVIAPSRPAPVVTPPQPVGGRNKPLIAAIAVALIVVIGGVAWFVMRPAAEPATVVTGAPTKPAPTLPQSAESDESNAQPPIATNPPAKTQPPAHNPDNRQHAPVAGTNNQPHNPDTTARVTPPPQPVHQQPAAPTDLSGQWQGFYFDKASQAKTTVRLSIREVDGNRITGSLVFQTSDNTTGQCDLNGSSYQGGTLRLLTHCLPKVVPYLNTYTTFQGVAPTTNQLSDGKVFAAKDVVASLQRN
jgi:serine/threonine-protein kinase